MRSLLIAPCDDETAVASALASEADAIILAVDRPAARAAARATASRVLAEAAPRADGPALLVRVSALASGETNADLESVMAHMPFAVVLPNCVGAASVQRLAAKLAVHEAERALKDGATHIVALADCAEALLELPRLRGACARLIGIAWDALNLSGDLGVDLGSGAVSLSGGCAGPLRLARDMILIAAAAARVAPIDTASDEDLGTLRAETLAARRDGFAAKLAINASQSRVINAAFAESAPD